MLSKKYVGALAFAASLVAGPSFASPLFFDDFESGLGLWTAKTDAGIPSSYTIVGPVGGHSNVLSFNTTNSAGDAFTLGTFSSPYTTFRLSFDYYGTDDAGGGFAGYSYGLAGAHVWLAGDAGYPGILQSLTNDGSWHHYDIVFSAPGSIHAMFEDFVSGAGGRAGDAYFDNVQLEAVPEPGTLLLIGSGLAGLALRRRRRD